MWADGLRDHGADAAISCATPCGDVTGDGVVDRDDIQALAVMLSTDSPLDVCTADPTGDGMVDGADLTTLAEIVAGAPPRCAP